MANAHGFQLTMLEDILGTEDDVECLREVVAIPADFSLIPRTQIAPHSSIFKAPEFSLPFQVSGIKMALGHTYSQNTHIHKIMVIVKKFKKDRLTRVLQKNRTSKKYYR